MEKAQSFQDLVVWKKAHQFVLSVYNFSKSFPANEIYGLTSQLRRAAVSVPANIVEGFKRAGLSDKLRFYNITEASLVEARYFLILAKDLNYGDSNEIILQTEEIGKLLTGLIRSIKKVII